MYKDVVVVYLILYFLEYIPMALFISNKVLAREIIKAGIYSTPGIYMYVGSFSVI